MNGRRRAIVVGFDYHARYLADVINEHGARWQLQAFPSGRYGTLKALWALRQTDVLISFGGPGPCVALTEAAEMRHIPIVVIWAGSDVLTVAEKPFDLPVLMRRAYDNVVVARWLVDELRTLGIEALHVPVAAISVEPDIPALPAAFRVLTYLPEPRRAFYGERAVYAIAQKMRDVEFVVLGNGSRNPNAPPNVTFAGHVDDVRARIDASTVLLRLTQHDGASVLVLEALARARHVVWNREFPCVHHAGTTDDALAVLQELYAAQRRGELAPNAEGPRYVRRHCFPPDVARHFEAHLDHVTTAHAGTNGRRKPRRVAISGLGVFSAEVATQVERLHPEWNASVLRTGSRLELCAALLGLVRAQVWYSIGSPLTDRWVHLGAQLLRKPHVIHWVGTDIEQFRNSPSVRKALRSPAIKHLTEVSWTARELQDLGMPSEIVPLPLRHHASGVKPLPKRFTIMLYLPKSRPDFYGKQEYEHALRVFQAEAPRVLVVGGGVLQAPEGVDVVNLGWRDDLRDIYQQATVLIRLTPRDGLSLMVLEALSFGRYVMWSKAFPYAMQVTDETTLLSGLRLLFERHRSGQLHAQYAAAEMISSRYDSERSVEAIMRAWESVR